MLNKLDIFINKHVDVQLFISGQKKIQKLPQKDIFKVVYLDKVVMPEEVSNNTQIFNSSLVDNISDPCIDKAYEKSCPVVHAYNNKKKILY